MNTIAWYLAVIAGLECLFQIIFLILKRCTVAKSWKEVRNRFSIELVRGLIERAMLTLGILAGFPQVLIPFGVLKLQNRIGFERDRNESTKEDARVYFLIGNMLTILAAVIYVLVGNHCFGIDLRMQGS